MTRLWYFQFLIDQQLFFDFFPLVAPQWTTVVLKYLPYRNPRDPWLIP